MKSICGAETYVRCSGPERSLIELLRTRASQITGSAFCLHMHTRDARPHGEGEERQSGDDGNESFSDFALNEPR